MNWRLIFTLSGFGIAMGLATVYFISSNLEPFCWLVIFAFCGYMIAKHCNEKYFLNGFCVSLVNAVWITSAHILLYKTYIAHHPSEAAMMANVHARNATPQLLMLVMGPVAGIISGIVLGSFAFIASRMVKKEESGF